MTNNECCGWLDNLDVGDTNTCEKCCESCEPVAVDLSDVTEKFLGAFAVDDTKELSVEIHEDESNQTIEYLYGNDSTYPFYLSSEAILPAISDVKAFKNQTVVVFFADGTKEHAFLHKGDTFSLEQGISICVTKRLLDSLSPIEGKGSAMYNKLIDYAIGVYEQKIEDKKAAEEMKKAEKQAKVEQRRKERELRKKAELEAENERDDLIEKIAQSIVRAREIIEMNDELNSVRPEVVDTPLQLDTVKDVNGGDNGNVATSANADDNANVTTDVNVGDADTAKDGV